jgi:hypothetical protein
MKNDWKGPVALLLCKGLGAFSLRLDTDLL